MSDETKAAKKRAPKAAKNEIASEVVGPATKSRAVVSLNPIEKIAAGLVTLKAEAKVFDVTTVDGEKAARAFRALCVSTRTSVDKAYEKVNRPLLDAQKNARALVADIKKAVLELEAPVDALIVAKEAEAKKRADERRAQIEAEIAAIRQKIRTVFALPRAPAGQRLTVADLIAARTALEQQPVGEDAYGDHTVEAFEAQAAAVEAVGVMLGEAQHFEDEQARLAKEREDLTEQRRKDAADRAERDKQEAAAKAEREAKEKAERDERAAKEAKERAEREQADQERRKEEEAAAKKRRDELAAEEQRLADARAQLAKEQAEARRQREEAEAEQRRQQQIEREREEAERRAADEKAARMADASWNMLGLLRSWKQIDLATNVAPSSPTHIQATEQRDALIDSLADVDLGEH